jgi:hypothetical protein
VEATAEVRVSAELLTTVTEVDRRAASVGLYSRPGPPQ